jgi:hypothetical protein
LSSPRNQSYSKNLDDLHIERLFTGNPRKFQEGRRKMRQKDYYEVKTNKDKYSMVIC